MSKNSTYSAMANQALARAARVSRRTFRFSARQKAFRGGASRDDASALFLAVGGLASMIAGFPVVFAMNSDRPRFHVLGMQAAASLNWTSATSLRFIAAGLFLIAAFLRLSTPDSGSAIELSALTLPTNRFGSGGYCGVLTSVVAAQDHELVNAATVVPYDRVIRPDKAR